MNNKKLLKQIIISREKLETRVALLKKDKLEEYQIERTGEEVSVGSVYIGRITNLEASLQAAFVDIGTGKNAFLHFWDMLPASYDMADKVEREHNSPETTVKKERNSFSDKIRDLLGLSKKSEHLKEIEYKRRKKKITIDDIPKLFPPGSELLVQVTKGPIGTKGPRVTTNITLPGRYLVLLPYADHVGLSSKIEDRKERTRLKKILSELDIPEGMGIICRTVGEGRKNVFFKRDLDMLLDSWQLVEARLQNPVIPSIVHNEPSLIERTVRDFLTEDIDEIIIDNYDTCREMQTLLTKFVGPKMADNVYYYDKPKHIFEYFNISEQVTGIFKREVKLPSGGYICVDETEALVAIDVNSGKSRKGKDQPETIIKTNLEALEEVARHLRLRNIGGLVVIDFIDMRSSSDREQVYRKMIEAVKDDRAKTKVLPLSKFGLMEMTRQREHESIKDAVYDLCPYCHGSGRVKSAMSMSVEIQRRLLEILRKYSRKEGISVRVIMHPTILARLKNEDADILMELENKYGKNLTFRGDPAVHLEEFKLVDTDTGAEYK